MQVLLARACVQCYAWLSFLSHQLPALASMPLSAFKRSISFISEMRLKAPPLSPEGGRKGTPLLYYVINWLARSVYSRGVPLRPPLWWGGRPTWLFVALLALISCLRPPLWWDGRPTSLTTY